MKYTFLLEIGTEELPSKILYNISKLFTKKIIKKFKNNNIFYKKKKIFASPRRLGLELTEIYYSNNKKIYNYGPSIKYAINKFGKFNSIAYSWMKKNKIKKKKIIFIKNKKNTFLSYKIKKIKIIILIKNIIKKILLNFSITKLMQWGTCKTKFIRPINNIIILLNKNIINLKIFEIKITKKIYGNPYINKKKITIQHASQYNEKIFKLGKVISNFNIRQNKIKNDALHIVKKIKGTLKIKKNILKEITSLVEWPKTNIAKFNKKFLNIPKEIIIYIIEKIQKCFPVYNNCKKIIPYFIFITNIESKKIKNIIIGNQNIINSKLSDANFFYKNDQKKKLEQYHCKLKNIIFHKKLGNILEKTRRIQLLIINIAKKNKVNIKYILRAAYLCKCDLVTKLVIEFPEMQGIIGMYYAKNNKEKKKIYLAIKEHYKPCFSKDKIPSNKISSILSITDKIDTITGMFIINKQPKGKNDPFGIRRITIGIVKIIIENKIKINLNSIINNSINLYKLTNNFKTKNIFLKIRIFIKNRLLEYYKKLGYEIKIIKSLLNNDINNLLKIDKFIKTIKKIQKSKKYIKIISIFKRINNILKKTKFKKTNLLKRKLLKKKEEKKILYLTITIKKKIKHFLNKEKYKKAILELLKFYEAINLFFKNIKINQKNKKKKKNRLILLNNIKKVFLKIINFSLF